MTPTWLVWVLLAQAPSGEAALIAAEGAYDEQRYEEAAKQADGALQDEALSRDLRARAHLLLGMVASAYNDDKKAEEAFAEALREDRNMALPKGVSPKIRARFAAAQKVVAAEPERPRPPPSSSDGPEAVEPGPGGQRTDPAVPESDRPKTGRPVVVPDGPASGTGPTDPGHRLDDEAADGPPWLLIGLGGAAAAAVVAILFVVVGGAAALGVALLAPRPCEATLGCETLP